MRDPQAVAAKYAAARAMLGRATRMLRFRLWAALLVALSAYLAFLPGFDSLSYYFCLVTALVGSLAAAHVGVGVVQVARREQPDATLGTLLRGAVGAALILAHLPLLVISANALRVKVCDYAGGVAFWFVGPLISMSLAAGFGVAAGLWTRRSAAGTALFIVGTLASFAWLAWHFYTAPQIFAYSPFFGVLIGAIYDDVIGISGTLVLYRMNNVVQLAAVLLLTRAALAPGALRARFTNLRGRALVPAALALAVSATLFGFRGQLGWEVSAGDIRRELGGRHDTEHVTIWYPADDPRFVKDIAWIAEDHEYRWQRLAALMGPHPVRIESFVYGSAAQRRRLMGADKVYVAKPWLHQIHLGRLPYGSGILEHELAHVFAGGYAPGPLHVTAQYWVLPHMALVEGLATAIEWDRGRLTPHQWSAAMLELGILPDLARIMGPQGYLTTFGGSAYTTAGSLVRWLMDERGMPAVLRLYGSGDFHAAFGEPMDALVTQWKDFLRDRSRVPLEPEDLERARFTFDRKPVLQRVCPIVVAGLEREADRSFRRGDLRRAADIRRTVLRWTPDEPGKKAALASVLLAAGDEEGRALVAEVLASDRAGMFLKAALRDQLADADWRAGNVDAARTAWEELRSAPLDQGSLRGIDVKLRALAHPDPTVRDGLRDALTTPRKTEEALAFLRSLSEAAPGDPLVAYLYGRRLFVEGRHAEALEPLRRARMADEPRTVTAERERMLGVALYFAGDPQAAHAHFAIADTSLPEGALGLRGEVQGWMDRCAWKGAGHSTAATGSMRVVAEPAVRSAGEALACDCGRP
ncbi:MAG: hypothetical protein AMXMBFR64_56090 [Myxococcales bacterium]